MINAYDEKPRPLYPCTSYARSKKGGDVALAGDARLTRKMATGERRSFLTENPFRWYSELGCSPDKHWLDETGLHIKEINAVDSKRQMQTLKHYEPSSR